MFSSTTTNILSKKTNYEGSIYHVKLTSAKLSNLAKLGS